MEEILKCKICKNSFDLFSENFEPIVIKCGHTFCKACIINKEEIGETKCHLCGINVNFEIENCSVNAIVIELLELIQRREAIELVPQANLNTPINSILISGNINANNPNPKTEVKYNSKTRNNSP
jgi:hypothetical protein